MNLRLNWQDEHSQTDGQARPSVASTEQLMTYCARLETALQERYIQLEQADKDMEAARETCSGMAAQQAKWVKRALAAERRLVWWRVFAASEMVGYLWLMYWMSGMGL